MARRRKCIRRTPILLHQARRVHHRGLSFSRAGVVIPTKFQRVVLAELHIGHPGMVRMKSLARLHVWWSTLDQDIEQTVRDCANCQFDRCKYPFKVSNPWIWPTRRWQRIHADFAGPMHGWCNVFDSSRCEIKVDGSRLQVLNHHSCNAESFTIPVFPSRATRRNGFR